MNIKYCVKEEISINQVLSDKLEMSTRLKNKLIKNKNILLNGSFVDTRTVVKLGDIITVILNYEEDNSNILPTKMDLDIIYEDEFLLAVNKPSGIAVHPSILHFDDSLANGVRYYFDCIGLKKKIRPVNRIDLNTSGIVLFAKSEYFQECLIKQMSSGIFKKSYLCIASGIFKNKNGIIVAPIDRKSNSIIERCVSPEGQIAITHYDVLKEFKDYSLVECKLETGRTHQIRVHMSHIGHPLLGDDLYNLRDNKFDLINRQALHSYKMEFVHPVYNNKIMLEADLHEDMMKIVK